MSCLIQLLACLGLVMIGLAIILGLLKPGEALQRIGAFFALLLLGPTVIALLAKGIIVPAARVAWSATKDLFVLASFASGLLLIAWLVAGLLERYRNRNSGEHSRHSEE